MFLDKIVHVMKNDYPIFHNLKLYGFYDQLSEDELIYVFSEIFGKPVRYTYAPIYNKNNNNIHGEIYDGDNNSIYNESSYNGYWDKIEYDENGNPLYFEDSSGYWWKREYDEDGNTIYFEDSMSGVMLDKR